LLVDPSSLDLKIKNSIKNNKSSSTQERERENTSKKEEISPLVRFQMMIPKHKIISFSLTTKNKKNQLIQKVTYKRLNL